MDSLGSLLSSANSTTGLQQEVDVTVLRKAMDAQTAQVATLIQGFTDAAHPYLGKSLDIRI